ncbi:MAG: hypothetical protein ACHQRO_16670 [Vicinamibacteria bacterium]|jgi:hypothetical protein
MIGSRRRWWVWGVAASIAAALAWPIAAPAPLKPPALLAAVLLAQPEWRLLDPATDLIGDYTVAQLEDLDRWPPWIEGDFDKDRKDDIAAVVVRGGGGRELDFTVIAVHAARPARAELVVPFAARRIMGVSDEFENGTVTPLYCVECDSNVWYRWNGRAYEPWLHVVGETLRISGEHGRRLTLFADPRPDAQRTVDVPLCVKAEVLQVRGREGQRWYHVEVDAPSSPRGWIPQQLVVDDVDCVG